MIDGASGNPRTKLTTTSARTREALILTGERLFAEQGLDNVSLRQINAEAGQRNSSAAHYHFGSKEALLAAIYEYRSERIDILRRAMLQRVHDQGRRQEPRALLEALVYPLVEHIDTAQGGRHFIRFLAQVYGHPAWDLRAMMRGKYTEAVGEIYLLLRQALPNVPDEVFGPRFGLVWELIIHALADRTRLSEVAADSGLMQYTLPVLFVSNLVDSCVAIVVGPASAETMNEIATLRQGDQRSA